MTEQPFGSHDARSVWSWPVRWAAAARGTAARGLPPGTLLHDPRFVAHRILDNLAALAYDARHGAPDAASAFVAAVDKLIAAAPWVVSETTRRTDDSATAAVRKSHDLSRAHSGVNLQRSVQAASENALLDEDGLIADSSP